MRHSVNGTIPIDYHMHSNISCDSQATMTQMCQSALDQHITEIAFTEHFDVKPYPDGDYFYRPAAYFEKLDEARRAFEPKGLTIRAGIEVGEYHCFRDIIQPVLDAWPYDVVLGSLHWVGSNCMFDADYFEATDYRDAFRAYFVELETMVRGGGFDVLSHMDVFKRTAYSVYHRYDTTEWEDLIRPVWRACIEGGIAIEINTAGLRYSIAQPHPAPEALRWYRDMGGELLTIGSDGHRPQHVGFGLSVALDMARAAGFTRVCTYEQRQVARWITI